MSLHNQTLGATDEWYTPPYVFSALGARFDLDVAHPGLHVVDWVPAAEVITEDSLAQEWRGFVWMNPPFGGRNEITPWLAKFFTHRNGVALTPDRTSTRWWQDHAAKADAVLFVAPKIKFIGADGKPGSKPADGTTLMAIGARAVRALQHAEVLGLGVVKS